MIKINESSVILSDNKNFKWHPKGKRIEITNSALRRLKAKQPTLEEAFNLSIEKYNFAIELRSAQKFVNRSSFTSESCGLCWWSCWENTDEAPKPTGSIEQDTGFVFYLEHGTCDICPVNSFSCQDTPWDDIVDTLPYKTVPIRLLRAERTFLLNLRTQYG